MGALQVFLGLYAYALPLLILAAWGAVSLWDLARREDLGRGAAAGWTAGVLLVPYVGSAAYLLSSRSIPRWLAVTYVAGGVGACLLLVGLTALVGGTR